MLYGRALHHYVPEDFRNGRIAVASNMHVTELVAQLVPFAHPERSQDNP